MVRLLISDGSWLVFRTAENATFALPERTEIPSAVPVGSEVGLESHTTRHLPSRTMGSVSFWALAGPAASHTAPNTHKANIPERRRQNPLGKVGRQDLPVLPDQRRFCRSPGQRGLPGEGEKIALSGLSGATFSSSPSFGARHWGTGSAEGSDGSRTAGDAQQLIARAELRLLSVARA